MEEVHVLRELAAIRALAHPLRIRLLSMLQAEGPATATTLSRVLAESTGATSYHLRQLARYGLIAEDRERGNQRDRWWRASAHHYNLAPELVSSAEYRAASAELMARVIERDAGVVAAFVEQLESFEPALRDAATFTNHAVYATTEEVSELRAEIHAAFARLERPDAAERPPDAVRFYGVLRLVPWPRELGPHDGTDR